MRKVLSGNHILACSSIGFVEVISALTRKQRADPTDEEDFRLLLEDVRVDWSRFLEVDCTSGIIQNAARLAQELGLRGADAIHLASALACSELLVKPNEQLVLVASDRELLAAALRLGLESFDPESANALPD
jgi:predicted nucleic acid-binding protein